MGVIDLLGALAVGFGAWGALRAARDALKRRADRRLAAESAAEKAILSGSLRELDAVLALHGDDLSRSARKRLTVIRTDLFWGSNP